MPSCRAAKAALRAAAFLVALLCSVPAFAAVTTYTGVYAGGTISAGNTVLLNNGASVTGNVVVNGTLQFNQSNTRLIVPNAISSTESTYGTIALTNSGTVNLLTAVPNLTTNVLAGVLEIKSGTGDFAIGNAGGGNAQLNVNGGSVTNSNGVLGNYGTATVSSGTWANSGTLVIGSNYSGTLRITGGRVTSSGGTIGGNTSQISRGTATVSSGAWANSGALVISGNGALNVTGGSVSNSTGYINSVIADNATATVSSGTWTNRGDLVIGYERGGPGYSDSRGGLNVIGGYVSNTNGYLGRVVGSIGTATVSSGTWENSGNLVVGGSGVGTLTITGGLVSVAGVLSTGSAGSIVLGGGGTLRVGNLVGDLANNGTLQFSHSAWQAYYGVISGSGAIVNASTGTTVLGQNSYSGPLVATAGRLIAGGSTSLDGFASTSGVSASTGATLELRSMGLAYLNGLSTLNDGTIRAANGISLGAGANVIGRGLISGLVSAARGSRIEATGNKLVVGDANSYIGFDSDGLLYTNSNEVELLDRNESVLGALTQLGTGSSGGTLRAANGILLEQGKNLAGRGIIYGNFINQGHVYGDGSAEGTRVVFDAGSTVSGNGSFENALFQGTYAPGNSPAITSLRDGGFGETSTLLIEVGGTQAGSQYDQVQNADTLSLRGGSLNVVLTNSFVPSPGNSFEILRYAQLSGDFGTVNLPAFDNGLGWQRVTTGTSMSLMAIRSAVSVDLAGGAASLASSGYASLIYAMSLDKSGAGTVYLDRPTLLTGSTTIQQGSLQLAHASALSASTISPLVGGTLSLTAGLKTTIGSLIPNVGGKVDVGTGLVTVAAGLSQPDLLTALQAGRGDGSWDGLAGICSTAIAGGSAARTIGWLDNGGGSVTFGYAVAGDTNLDWSIDILDVAGFLSSGKFNSGEQATWAEGDFTYDGFADILDVADFMSAGLFNAGPYNASASLIITVPEPSVAGLAAISVAGLQVMALRRRRVA